MRKFFRDYNIFAIMVIHYVVFAVVRPEKAVIAAEGLWQVLKPVILLIPLIFLLQALIDVWLPTEEQAEKFDSTGKSTWALVYSIILSKGSLKDFFPVAQKLMNSIPAPQVMTILTVSGFLQISMLPLELAFLGWKLTLARWGVTLLVLLAGAYLVGLWQKAVNPIVANKLAKITFEREN